VKLEEVDSSERDHNDASMKVCKGLKASAGAKESRFSFHDLSPGALVT
jgi:hypothetical protein